MLLIYITAALISAEAATTTAPIEKAAAPAAELSLTDA
jgi:hypothetical protein